MGGTEHSSSSIGDEIGGGEKEKKAFSMSGIGREKRLREDAEGGRVVVYAKRHDGCQ